jgi:HD-like signal output (HDOD) protein
MGSMLVRHWGLPPELATVARYHHDVRDSKSPLVMVVALADSLAKQAGIGYDGDNRLSPDLEEIREQLQIGTEEWERLCAFAGDKKKGVEGFFRGPS